MGTPDWKVVPCDSRDEWLVARHRYLTASDVSAVMGLNPNRTREVVLAGKVPLEAPADFSTRPMRLGAALEDAVLRVFAEELRRELEGDEGGIPVPTGTHACRNPYGTSILVEHPEEPTLAASPDGLLNWSDGRVDLVEVKVTGPNGWMNWSKPSPPRVLRECARYFPVTNLDPAAGVGPLKHWVQLQVQMACTGIPRGWLVVNAGTALTWHMFELDRAFAPRIVEAAAGFAMDVRAARAAEGYRPADAAS